MGIGGVARLKRSTLHARLQTTSRFLAVSAVIAAAAALAGCDTDGTNVASARALRPLSAEMVAEIEKKNMPKESPILVRIFKEEAEFEVWKQDATGHFAHAQDLSDLPLVRRARSQGQGGRPPGARGLLHHHARAR